MNYVRPINQEGADLLWSGGRHDLVHLVLVKAATNAFSTARQARSGKHEMCDSALQQRTKHDLVKHERKEGTTKRVPKEGTTQHTQKARSREYGRKARIGDYGRKARPTKYQVKARPPAIEGATHSRPQSRKVQPERQQPRKSRPTTDRRRDLVFSESDGSRDPS